MFYVQILLQEAHEDKLLDFKLLLSQQNSSAFVYNSNSIICVSGIVQSQSLQLGTEFLEKCFYCKFALHLWQYKTSVLNVMFAFFFLLLLLTVPFLINNPFEKLLPEQAVFLCLCFYFSTVSEANEVLNKVDLQSPADSILGAGKKGFLSPLRQLKD